MAISVQFKKQNKKQKKKIPLKHRNPLFWVGQLQVVLLITYQL